MLKNSRKAMGHGDLRFLKNPTPLQIAIGNHQEPHSVLNKGYWLPIWKILDKWHVEDEWWKTDPIDRIYYECVLNNGKYIVMYRDCISNDWYKQ